MDSFIDEILNKHIMSKYYEIQHEKKTDEHSDALRAFESKRRGILSDARGKTIENYQLAYMLSGKRDFIIAGLSFLSPDDLTDHLMKLLNQSMDQFNMFCDKLIDNNNKLDVQFESWLIMLGNKDKIDQWRSSL